MRGKKDQFSSILSILSEAVLANLLSNLRLVFFLAYPAFAASCDPPHFPDYKKEYSYIQDSVLTKVNLSASSYTPHTDINSLDIFFFNNDRLKRLDSYLHLEESSFSGLELVSGSGEKIIAAVANWGRDKYLWKSAGTYSSLLETYSELSGDSPFSPVMSALGTIKAGVEKTVNLNLKPLLCAVKVSSITCDFSGRPYNNSNLDSLKVYLCNVNSRAPLIDTSSSVSIKFINQGGCSKEEMSTLTHPETLFKDLRMSLSGSPARGRNTVCPDLTLYCYENRTEREDLGAPLTRLVVEGRIDGVKYYYPININSADFGAEKGSEGVRRACLYDFDIKITRKGSSDPDCAVPPGSLEFSIRTKEWEEVNCVNISY